MYERFAGVYDLFMDDVPYDDWAGRITAVLKENGIKSGSLICDLACGTGQMTRRLAAAGYDMIGIDASVEMLDVARQTESGGADSDILYICQDIREFELYGTVAAVVSVCDAMNYLLAEEELSQVFALAANYLDPKGLFIFDMKTPYLYRTILGEDTFAENREAGSYIWDNHFDEQTGINEYELTLFIKEEEDVFRRYTEVHRQRAYPADKVSDLLKDNGMELLSVTDAATGKSIHDATERMVFTARSMKN